jgi:hypothetical protein
MSVGARVLAGWVLGGVGIAVGFAWTWLAVPTDTDATGGQLARFGVLTTVVIAPLLLGALRLGRLDRNSHVAAWLLPAVLAAAVLVAALIVGFSPDAFVRCARLRRFGIAGPECVTTSLTRLHALAEAGIVWGGFGLVTLAARHWSRR